MAKLLPHNIALRPDQHNRLLVLVGRGRMSRFVRRGVDMVLADLECQARLARNPDSNTDLLAAPASSAYLAES